MSQQNFVQQTILFMEYGKRNRLTSYERMFWLGLFHIANDLAQKNPKHEWPDDFFPVSNSTFTEWTGLEERNIRTIKNRFRQIGLIDFKKGDGKKSDPEYRIFYLRYIGYKIVPDSVTDNAENEETDDKNVPGSAGGSVGDSVPDTVGDAVPDPQETGDKFAADSAGDPLRSLSTPGVFNININRGTVKAGANTGENAEGSPRGHARARVVVEQMRQRQEMGLVDLEDSFEGTDGLVPLPWWDSRG